MNDNERSMRIMEMWKDNKDEALQVMTVLIQDKVKNARLYELEPDGLKKRIGEVAVKLKISKTMLLEVTKVIVRQTLEEVLSDLEKMKFSK